MKKVIVSTDSPADLAQVYAERDIPVLPLTVILGDREGPDGEITPEDIYEYFAQTKKTPKTAAVSPDVYEAFFSKYTADGSEMVHFTISSDMSACYNNACIVAEKYPGVHVIDSHNLSTGIGLQVLYARDLADRGLSAADIAEKVEARKSAVQASFIVDTMDFLYRGGRCGGMSAFFASVLRIHPSIYVDPVSGKMVVGKKYIGNVNKVTPKYVADTLEKFPNIDPKYVFVTHTSASGELVEQVKRQVLEVCPEANVICTVAGATVTSHCGKGTLGVLYYNDNKADA